MANKCKTICNQFTLEGLEKNASPNAYGFRYCRVCSKFVKAGQVNRCLCCNGLVRSTPRTSKQRKQITRKRIL